MKTIEAFFGHPSETFRPYIHSDYLRNPLIFIWRAKTAKGRWSKHWCSVTVYGNNTVSSKLSIAESESKPKLPKGYTWSNTMVYSNNPIEIPVTDKDAP